MANIVTRKELAEIIGEKTMHITNRQKLANAVAAYLSSEHKTVNIGSLMRDVMQYRLERGIVEAMAVSAHELTPVVLKDIKILLREHFPHTKTVLLDQRVDPEVIGGIRIELPQEVLDLSVKSKLNLFKRLVAEEGVK
ncbi:MAG: F0F1 ATP synthase subunit delta [bacterium]|nr:F0F1 ATP synthase subunit delta [bacterium]